MRDVMLKKKVAPVLTVVQNIVKKKGSSVRETVTLKVTLDDAEKTRRGKRGEFALLDELKDAAFDWRASRAPRRASCPHSFSCV